MYQSIPKLPTSPGHLTYVKLCTVGNLTQNEARPLGHLNFVSKCLSVVGNKRISQFFDSAHAPHSWVITLVDSTWVFPLLSLHYMWLNAIEAKLISSQCIQRSPGSVGWPQELASPCALGSSRHNCSCLLR